MNAQDLMTWAKNEKARLEEKGRTKGGQYKAALRWIEDAEKLTAVPADYDWPEIDEDGIKDPREWAARVLEADSLLKVHVRFGGLLSV